MSARAKLFAPSLGRKYPTRKPPQRSMIGGQRDAYCSNALILCGSSVYWIQHVIIAVSMPPEPFDEGRSAVGRRVRPVRGVRKRSDMKPTEEREMWVWSRGRERTSSNSC